MLPSQQIIITQLEKEKNQNYILSALNLYCRYDKGNQSCKFPCIYYEHDPKSW